MTKEESHKTPWGQGQKTTKAVANARLLGARRGPCITFLPCVLFPRPMLTHLLVPTEEKYPSHKDSLSYIALIGLLNQKSLWASCIIGPRHTEGWRYSGQSRPHVTSSPACYLVPLRSHFLCRDSRVHGIPPFCYPKTVTAPSRRKVVTSKLHFPIEDRV